MKQAYSVMSPLILGVLSPSNEIGVYILPSIEELKELSYGVDTYDHLKK